MSDTSMAADEPAKQGISASAEVPRQLRRILDDFRDEIDRAPTLAEFLEILSVSVPSRSQYLDRVGPPLRMSATLLRGRRYRSRYESAVSDLNDATFVAASDWLAVLAESVSRATGTEVTEQSLADAVLAAIRSADISFSDVESDEVSALAATPSNRKTRRPKRGDVLAIPGEHGSYYFAVVLERNRFGTALGIFLGSHALARLPADSALRPLPWAVHTDDRQVLDGNWPIIEHREDLTAQFPAEAEIYHGTHLNIFGDDVGEFGAAETAAGRLRLIGKEEADAVGLTDRTYRQSEMSEYLPAFLAARAEA
jgi:hypothetical protein